MDPLRLRALVRTALERRAALRDSETTNAYRVMNDVADGLADVTVDAFGEVLVLSLFRAFTETEERAIADALFEVRSPKAIYVKRRPVEARVVATTKKAELAPPLPIVGEPIAETIVLEGGLRYEIRPGEGLAVGLYLDMRDTRAWLREQVRGATVLNTFAYTCAFAVNAAAGGASRVVNVDLSRKSLDWGKRNLAHNQLGSSERDFIAGDVFDQLRRFEKKGERFEVVVLDPPSFARGKRGVWSAGKDYPKLVEAAAKVTAPDGLLVCCCNLAELGASAFRELVARGLSAARRTGERVHEGGASPVDFPSHPRLSAGLKVVALRVSPVGGMVGPPHG